MNGVMDGAICQWVPASATSSMLASLRMPRGVALDPKNKSLIVTDKRLNAVLTFHFPEIF